MNREIADAWLQAFIEKDLTNLKLAEDFVHTSPFGAIRGRDIYLEIVRANEEAFFSQSIDMVDVFRGPESLPGIVGEKFVYRYRVGEMDACDCVYIQNGQIAEIFSYYHFGEKPVM